MLKQIVDELETQNYKGYLQASAHETYLKLNELFPRK